MAETGDPKDPRPAHPDPDDLVGFASSDALRGQMRQPPAGEPTAPEPEVPSEPERDLFDPPLSPGAEPALTPAPRGPVMAAPLAAGPISAEPVAAAPVFARRDPRTAPPAGALGLYSVYVLILFAVPTLGVSAAIGLLAVTGREPPADPVARSHFIYQQRTLWAAAFAALLGAILIVVNIGVFVLFVLAIWMLARGAVGVMRLKAGHAIPDPRHWLF